MYCTLKSCFCRNRVVRALSTGEISTALRPFYFTVHPDLFGQFPTQRTVNENSLKQLSSIIETLQQQKPICPTILPFYLRSRDENESKAGKFTLVKIQLNERDVRKAILSILKTCNLPTTFVDKIEQEKPNSGEKSRYSQFRGRAGEMDFSNLEDDPIFTSIIMKRKIDSVPDTFKAYLDKHVNEAHVKFEACRPVRSEVEKLELLLCEALGLKSITWDCGWNITHYRGCLLAFQALAKHHPEPMEVLRDRQLVFANDTGISVEGNVMLNSGEVRHNWLDKVWLSDLSTYEIVIETEAGPLMLSPTGQFIVPSSCPSFLLVSFITENLEEASKRLLHYNNIKHVERELHNRAIRDLGLAALNKDDSITPDLMIECCERLLLHKRVLAPALEGVMLWVTHYYSIMSDGVLCVPWDWRL
ncbi:T-cell activation inhibitor, mitochondrial-like [Belonocnema kinseyi]|uniref:T-cell activation inhibitor, mitochondrial-like n=1 Tax=Belonocnema kinseyi TaxID=2817044 RepID=UPI00143CC0F9|nr:T-cell activation inhibitor, mitochondrial-like [Belonocnema kinseyi]